MGRPLLLGRLPMTAEAVAAGPRVVVEVSADEAGWGGVAAWEALTTRAVAEAVTIAPDVVPEAAEISVRFSGDDVIRDLNHRFRARDSATNVLSFPAPAMPAGPGFLGDIVLAWETVAGEAAEQDLTIDAHVTHLLVHGFLHLLGYDHGDDVAARQMESLETAILARLGIDDPYRSDDRP